MVAMPLLGRKKSGAAFVAVMLIVLLRYSEYRLAVIGSSHSNSALSGIELPAYTVVAVVPPAVLAEAASLTVEVLKTKGRIKWRKNGVNTPLAKLMFDKQNPENPELCDPSRIVRFSLVWTGQGSAMHIWSNALCQAFKDDKIVVTTGPWIFRSKQFCTSSTDESPFECYFGRETSCPREKVAESETGWAWYEGPGLFSTFKHHEDLSAKGACTLNRGQSPGPWGDTHEVRTAGMDYLFRDMPEPLIALFEERYREVFGPGGSPDELISLHVRWGEKGKESDLVPIETYIQSVHQLISKHSLDPNSVTVLLTTEDPAALVQFKQKAPEKWKLLSYQNSVSSPLDPNREFKVNDRGFFSVIFDYLCGRRSMDHASSSGGHIGLESIISLMLSLEARFFVGTCSSNWSRLINELRDAKREPSCGYNCTDFIDLMPGGWRRF
jgi:hypothetical protein